MKLYDELYEFNQDSKPSNSGRLIYWAKTAACPTDWHQMQTGKPITTEFVPLVGLYADLIVTEQAKRLCFFLQFEIKSV